MLFGATVRGQPDQPTLDMAMVAWGPVVWCVMEGGPPVPFYFVHSMPAGIKWPWLEAQWFLESLLNSD